MLIAKPFCGIEHELRNNAQALGLSSLHAKLNYWKDIFVKSSQHTVRYAAFKTKESLDKLKLYCLNQFLKN